MMEPCEAVTPSLKTARERNPAFKFFSPLNSPEPAKKAHKKKKKKDKKEKKNHGKSIDVTDKEDSRVQDTEERSNMEINNVDEMKEKNKMEEVNENVGKNESKSKKKRKKHKHDRSISQSSGVDSDRVPRVVSSPKSSKAKTKIPFDKSVHENAVEKSDTTRNDESMEVGSTLSLEQSTSRGGKDHSGTADEEVAGDQDDDAPPSYDRTENHGTRLQLGGDYEPHGVAVTTSTLFSGVLQGQTTKHLVLFRMPKEFDLALLDGRELSLDAEESVQCGEKNGFAYNAVSRENKTCDGRLVLPMRNKPAVVAVDQKFSHIVQISKKLIQSEGGASTAEQPRLFQGVAIPPRVPTMSRNIPKGLKERNKPFGSGPPLDLTDDAEKSSNRSHKKKHRLKDDIDGPQKKKHRLITGSVAMVTPRVDPRGSLDIDSALASPILSETPTPVYGEHLREQVEDRLKFYETGKAPRKNIDVMQEAMGQAASDAKSAKKEKKKKKKKKKEKKRKSGAADESNADADDSLADGDDSMAADVSVDTEKKKKKDKKRKSGAADDSTAAETSIANGDVSMEGKKKKKDKKRKSDVMETSVNGDVSMETDENDTPGAKKQKKKKKNKE